jgi:hypothetical protein
MDPILRRSSFYYVTSTLTYLALMGRYMLTRDWPVFEVSAAAAAKSVDPIFVVRYARLLSALRQGLLADPGMLYWPMYRASMVDFIEERTGRPPDWSKLVFVVGDHGGSGVGLAMLVEPVMSEVDSLHVHLESLDRREAILESYMKGAAKSP